MARWLDYMPKSKQYKRSCVGFHQYQWKIGRGIQWKTHIRRTYWSNDGGGHLIRNNTKKWQGCVLTSDERRIENGTPVVLTPGTVGIWIEEIIHWKLHQITIDNVSNGIKFENHVCTQLREHLSTCERVASRLRYTWDTPATHLRYIRYTCDNWRRLRDLHTPACNLRITWDRLARQTCEHLCTIHICEPSAVYLRTCSVVL